MKCSSGRRPFRGESSRDVFDEILRREPKPPRMVDDGIPEELERITLRCLSKKVADRPTTAIDLANELRAWVARSHAARSGGTVTSEGSAAARKLSKWMIFGTVAAAILVMASWMLREQRPAANRERNNNNSVPVRDPQSLLGAAIAQNAGLSQKLESLDDMVSDLRANGQDSLASEWLSAIEQKREEARLYRANIVLVGRVLAEGASDPRDIKAQMEILDQGYFATVLADPAKPLEFRLHGYVPADFVLVSEKPEGTICVGTINLKLLSDGQDAVIRGQVALPDISRLPDVEIRMSTTVDSNHPSNGTSPRSYWPDPIRVAVDDAGTFLVKGFSPCRYWFSVDAPRHVGYSQHVEFKPGEVLNVGVIALEVPTSIQIEYRVSKEPTFQDAETRSERIVPGATTARWRADKNMHGWDLEFEQAEGNLSFSAMYFGTRLAYLGKGPIGDFLDIHAAEAKFNRPESVRFEDGGVYIVHTKHDFEHWALFRASVVSR